MPRARTAVRYHVPRDRSPVPPVVVGALVVLTLVAAQLSLAVEPSRPAPASSVAAAPSGPTAEPTAEHRGEHVSERTQAEDSAERAAADSSATEQPATENTEGLETHFQNAGLGALCVLCG